MQLTVPGSPFSTAFSRDGGHVAPSTFPGRVREMRMDDVVPHTEGDVLTAQVIVDEDDRPIMFAGMWVRYETASDRLPEGLEKSTEFGRLTALGALFRRLNAGVEQHSGGRITVWRAGLAHFAKLIQTGMSA